MPFKSGTGQINRLSSTSNARVTEMQKMKKKKGGKLVDENPDCFHHCIYYSFFTEERDNKNGNSPRSMYQYKRLRVFPFRTAHLKNT